MRFLEFNMLPLPFCIICGEDFYTDNDYHPDRDNLTEFDLLVVTTGKLPITEETSSWEIKAGQALVLRPNKRHFQPYVCSGPTHFFWLHFQTNDSWSESIVEDHSINKFTKIHSKVFDEKVVSNKDFISLPTTSNRFTFKTFTNPLTIKVAQLSTLLNPEKTYADFRTLIKLQQQPQTAARWKQQIIFQNVLEDLNDAHNQLVDNSLTDIAERVAIFLRENYTKDINYKLLHQELNFHPVYLARCMQRIYGCTPIEYLTQFRLEQAKLLLINSDIAVGKIAEQIGFHHSGKERTLPSSPPLETAQASFPASGLSLPKVFSTREYPASRP